eukprot:50621-Eustigmatos_ZCMA.PRE.1
MIIGPLSPLILSNGGSGYPGTVYRQHGHAGRSMCYLSHAARTIRWCGKSEDNSTRPLRIPLSALYR